MSQADENLDGLQGGQGIVRKSRAGGLGDCSSLSSPDCTPESLSMTAVGAKISRGGVHVKVVF